MRADIDILTDAWLKQYLLPPSLTHSLIPSSPPFLLPSLPPPLPSTLLFHHISALTDDYACFIQPTSVGWYAFHLHCFSGDATLTLALDQTMLAAHNVLSMPRCKVLSFSWPENFCNLFKEFPSQRTLVVGMLRMTQDTIFTCLGNLSSRELDGFGFGHHPLLTTGHQMLTLFVAYLLIYKK